MKVSARVHKMQNAGETEEIKKMAEQEGKGVKTVMVSDKRRVRFRVIR